jgi:dTDP-4-amino-4,6-dideoxygalactose transaminase
VSRLYGKSLPQIVGMPAEEAAEHWPNAVWIAERLITLPTHGRLGSGDENELRAMLRHLAA